MTFLLVLIIHDIDNSLESACFPSACVFAFPLQGQSTGKRDGPHIRDRTLAPMLRFRISTLALDSPVRLRP